MVSALWKEAGVQGSGKRIASIIMTLLIRSWTGRQPSACCEFTCTHRNGQGLQALSPLPPDSSVITVTSLLTVPLAWVKLRVRWSSHSWWWQSWDLGVHVAPEPDSYFPIPTTPPAYCTCVLVTPLWDPWRQKLYVHLILVGYYW